VDAEKLRATVTPKFTVRSEGPAPYRMLAVANHESVKDGSMLGAGLTDNRFGLAF
jgi:hypothetical protein